MIENINNRRTERIPLKLEISYAADSKYRATILEGELHNITDGAGGVCININDEPAVGSEIMLKLTLPDEKNILCTGRIVWTSENDDNTFSAGIKFDLDDEDIEYIKSVLSIL